MEFDSDDKAKNHSKDKKPSAGELISLKQDAFRLYNFLKTRSVNPSDWPTLDEIKSQLRFQNLDYAQKQVNTLLKTDGIDLLFRKDKEDQKRRYGLAPQVLERLVIEEGSLRKKHDDFSYCALYLAEPTFGTKAHDEHTMKGLALFLDVNDYAKSIQQVVIQGGVIPHIPPFSSKSNLNDLRFLGWVKRKGEDKTISEQMLEERIDNNFEQAFYEEHINNKERKKITTLTDAFEAAEVNIKALMSILPQHTILRIQTGEEDHKNISHIEDTYIKKWADDKEEQIGKLRGEAKENLVGVYTQYFKDALQEKFLNRASRDKKLHKKPNENREQYRERVDEILRETFSSTQDELYSIDSKHLEENEPGLVEKFFLTKSGRLGERSPRYMGGVLKEAADFVYWASDQQEPVKKMADKLKQLADEKLQLRTEEKDLDSRLEDLNTAMSWTENLMSGPMSSVTWFTKHYPVFADEVELAFKKAKDQYTSHFFGWDIKQQLVIHVSPRKNIQIQTGIVDDLRTGSKLKAKAEVEYQEITDGEKKMMLIHNIRQTFSESVAPRAIREAKLEMNYENMVLKKLFEDSQSQPDIMLLGGHMSGGFRTMPWFKDSEHMIDGEFIKGQKIAYLVTLPTLQSIPNLQWLVAHNFRNWHTKRLLTGPYASAAVIHTEDYDGVNRFTIIDSSELVKLGKIADELATYKAHLDTDKDLSKDAKEKLSKIIKERKVYVRNEFKRIEIAGDFHLGAPDKPGHYSKDQLIRATQHYQQEHRLPDMVCWDEVLHGTEERIFSSASRYTGVVPEKFRQAVVEKILQDPQLPDDEKARLIAKEALGNMRAMTIHNASEQKHLYKILMKPYTDKVLASGGKLVLMSGNHYNKSHKNSDEALELANQYDEAQLDKGQIILFTGKGNDVGVGTTMLEGGNKLFGLHKFPEKQDEIYGVLAHLRKMNNDADIVIAGDRHQTGGAYADGHLAVLHPGYEPINEFVPLIGKPAGIRGFINVDYDPRKRVYAMEFILNPTLEKIIEKEKII